ncbi:DNA-processing protein DprA [Mycoplasmopsis verecunda]|uniref:DNA processing protein n=1 Tax=Mycoplasmopsis verecunda TaxID=171291 RepID=A0A1T4M6D6_9BACT|nr:DNA-processing protein DprA [Mycoplasmopsis verecunda]WPB54507.1 DNA-processing protein DprA [Mycoplasmopsis verecunda]SJZ62461.1 DNA processing protein [Mycoplasmopsis verecunda]
MNELLFYTSNKYKGDSFLIFKEIKNFKQISRKQLIEWKQLYEQLNVRYFTILDDTYPSDFNILRYPPYVLYYKGNANLLREKNRLYIINENTNVKYLSANIETLVKNSILVTNGYEKERNIINLFRQHKGKIIHILKEGIDRINTQDIDLNNELFISQYPLGVHPKRHHYKESNIIASIIATQAIIFSLDKDSKAFHLIDYFNDIGKEINCFPSSTPDDGNDILIKSGANYVTLISECINI